MLMRATPRGRKNPNQLRAIDIAVAETFPKPGPASFEGAAARVAAFDPHQFDRYFAIVQLVEIGWVPSRVFLVRKVVVLMLPSTPAALLKRPSVASTDELRLAVRQICFAAVKGNHGVLGAGDHQERERMRGLARVSRSEGRLAPRTASPAKPIF